MKTILIIGGAGYIGTQLTKRLLEEGYSVRVLDNYTWGRLQNLYCLNDKRNFDYIPGDMCDIEILIRSMKDVYAVIHLAAIVGDGAGHVNPEKTNLINSFCTKVITEACRYMNIRRMIFASTCSVYGESDGEQLTEESFLYPVSEYARSKIQAETRLLLIKDDAFKPTIFRQGTVYGPSDRMRFDLVVNLLTAKAYFDHEITIFGGDQWRPFVHIDDLCNAYLEVLKAPIDKVGGKIFNICTENIQIKSLIPMFRDVFDGLKINNRNMVDPRNYNVSSEKFDSYFNTMWKQRHISHGIKQIVKKLKQGYWKDWKDVKYNNYKTELKRNETEHY